MTLGELGIVGSYQLLSILGKGSFGVVYRARHILTQCEVAVKFIHLENSVPISIERQISVMRTLDHPFIVCLFDIIKDGVHLYLVTELVERGTLLTVMQEHHHIPEKEARRFFYELMLALRYLHDDRHVSHRYISAENVLIDVNGHIRLANFDFARLYDAESPLMNTSCGSPAYTSPEIIKKGGYTASADLWSAGVLLYFLLTGKFPFTGESSMMLFAAILMHEPEYPSDLSDDAQNLLRGLLQKDPATRFGITEIMAHPWLSEYAIRPTSGLASMRVVTGNTLDSAVMGAMHTLNLATGDLIGALARGEIDRVTAVYKMLRRERHAEELEQWCKSGETGASLDDIASRVTLNEKSSLARSYDNHARPIGPISFTQMARKPNETGVKVRPGVVVPRIRKLVFVRPDCHAFG
jgi:serine/threonine protein kinase